MLNQIPSAGELRRPRGIVRAGGVQIPGWLSIEVENNAYYSADTFHVTFALSDLPAETDAAWWSNQTNIDVELFAGFPNDPTHYDINDLSSLILGAVDEVSISLDSQVLTVTGRDYTAKFIDTKTTEKWANKRPHEIAKALAQRHGMLADVDPVSQRAGVFYEIDHIHLTDERSEWDLLTWLAAQCNRRVWVRGNTLYFKAPPATNDDKYVIQWDKPNTERSYYQASFKTIELSRNLNVAKGVVVQVRSWNARNKKGFTAQYPKKAKGTTAGSSSATSQIYSYSIPGLTPEQALQRAQALHKQITAHELKLHATLPADNVLDVGMQIELRGTGTAFDTIYYPDSVTRTLELNGGYEMRIAAKNHSPESEPTL